MKKNILLTVILISGVLNCFSKSLKDSVQWISLEKANELFLKNQKPILIYFYQNNNDSCRLQESSTFSNPEVANYINVLFYPVKIDAETKESLTFFDGIKYENTGKTGKLNDLTIKLCGPLSTFPTLVIFNKRAEGAAFPGYFDRDEIFRRLIYYSEEIYDSNVEFNDWLKIHKKGFPAGQTQIMTRLLVKWKTLDEALAESKIKPKKILLNLYNYNKISCTLMRITVLNNPEVAAYLNENYYPVNIDAFTQDTLEIFGQKYINENQPHKFHQLPIAALSGKMIFPAFIIIDQNNKVLEKVQRFLTIKDTEALLHFYGDNEFQTKDWNTFKSTFVSKVKD